MTNRMCNLLRTKPHRRLRAASVSFPESKAPGMHLRRHERLTRFNLQEAIAVLGRTPATLDALLRGLPDAWVRSNEGNDTWSALVIVGHLVVGERTDWMPRVRILLENGEARPFDPFDRSAERRFKTSRWSNSSMNLPGCGGRTWLRCRP